MAPEIKTPKESAMFKILRRSTEDATHIDPEVVTAFRYALFRGKKTMLHLTDKQLKQYFEYLKNVIAIYGIKNEEELLNHFTDADEKAAALHTQYIHADFPGRIEIEEKLHAVFDIENVAQNCVARASYFSTLGKNSSAAPLPGLSKKMPRAKSKTDLYSQSF